ncbi:MAG: glycohydrolase toxin TNT-related protein [Bacteroidetes bacterium]|nr:glycohydrolase toxin TNT-related protein [Bacteroidota bacterium]
MGSDTAFVDSGYTINIVVDTPCKYLARNINHCTCSGSHYFSAYTLIGNYNVTTVPRMLDWTPLNYMPTLASGTSIDVVPTADTFLLGFTLNRDNALVSGNTSSVGNFTYFSQPQLGAVLTNTTGSNQRVKYYIRASYYGVYYNTFTGYFTVLPNTLTSPSPDHCIIPKQHKGQIQQNIWVLKNANLVDNMLEQYGTLYGGAPINSIDTVDAIDWYKTRWRGDTTFLGSSVSPADKPIYSSSDTGYKILTVSRNVCHWSDGSQHEYKSGLGLFASIAISAGTMTNIIGVNNTPYIASGGITNITLTGTPSGIVKGMNWYRTNTTKVSGVTSYGSTSPNSVVINDTLINNTDTPQKVFFVSNSNSNVYGWWQGENHLDSVIVYPPCNNWSGLGTAIHSLKDSICPGDTATLTADTVPGVGSHYLWSTGDTTKTIHPTVAGTYTVTVTNSFGCSAMAYLTLILLPVPSATILNDTVCPGTYGVLSALAGKSYLWSTGDTSQYIVTATPGTYTVRAIDSFGCAYQSIGSIISTPQWQIFISNDTICNGDTAILSISGIDRCIWSTYDSTTIIRVTSPGTYFVTALDSSGCSRSFSANAVLFPAPQITISSYAACLGDSAELIASGGASYSWSDGSSSSILKTTLSALYTVTALDAFGCSATATEISEIDTVKLKASNVSACFGSMATVTASGANQYLWNTGDSMPVFQTLMSGTYIVTGTDVNGCKDSVDVIVSFHGPVVSATSDSIAYGDTAVLTGYGGTIYLWSNGMNTQSIIATEGGTYDVTITDSIGCSAVSTGEVYVDPATMPKALNDTIYEGDTAVLEADGGVSYVWSTGDTTSRLRIVPVNTTTYSVTITGLNWTKTLNPVALVKCRFEVSLRDTNVCYGQLAPVTAQISGSYNSLSYLWSDGDLSQTTIANSGGAYTVSVTDQHGCTASASAVVGISIPVSVNSVSIFPGTTATLVAAGGSTYVWSTGSQNDTIHTASSGVYSVTAVDTFGCTSSSQGTVTVITINSSNGGAGQYVSLQPLKSDIPSLNTGLPVGLTPGYSEVTPLGAASYNIPICLPPGTSNFAPKLALDYNSNFGNGYMGWGWNLNGLSSITRSGHNNFIDNEVGPITYGNKDHFVMDGQVLIPTSGSNGMSGTTYGKECEDYSVIKSYGNIGTYDGPEWFKVTTKEGLTIEYGHTADSRVLANGPNLPSDLVFTWRVNKMYDQDGNYITFKYETGLSSPKITEIDYTGNDAQGISPYNKIIFNYLSRVDKNVTYAAGSSFNSDFLLGDITITGENGAAYKKYEFDYGTDDISSYLSQVTEYGSDGSHLNPTRFTYGTADNFNSYNTSSYNFQDDISAAAKSTYALINYHLMSGDFNGDGFSDMLTIGNAVTPNSGTHISNNVLSMVHFMDPSTNQFYKVSEDDKSVTDDTYRENGFTLAWETNPSYYWGPPASPYTHGDYNYYVGDFLGQGHPGILEISRKFYGTGFQYTNGYVSGWPEERIGVDVVKFTTYDNAGSPSNHFWPAPPLAHDPGIAPEQWFYQGDFDGDGTEDYIISTIDNAFINFPSKGIFNQVIQNNMTGMGTIALSNCESLMNPWCDVKRMILDFDGDGKSDMMIVDKLFTKIFSIQKNSSGLYSFELLSESTQMNNTDYNGFYLGDFNGDGKTDVLTRKYSNQNIEPILDPFQTGLVYYNLQSNIPLLGGSTLGALHVNWDIWYSTGKEFEQKPFKSFAMDPRAPSFSETDGFDNPYSGGFSSGEFDYEKAKVRDACVGDFNGDGKSDILLSSNLVAKLDNEHWFYYGCGDLTMYYSAGSAFKEYVIAKGLSPMKANYSVLGDFNGDGRTDLSFYHVVSDLCTSLPKTHGNYDDYFQFSFNPKSLQRFLLTVTDGFEQTKTFNYKPLTNSFGPIHTRGTSSTYPLISVQYPLFVVSSVTEPSGAGGTITTNYSYENAQFHLGGKGFLGFYSINSTVLPSNIGNSSYYTFSAPYYASNNLFVSSYHAGSLAPISGEDRNYNYISLAHNRFAIQKTHNLYTDYMTGSFTESFFSYDNHGNVTQTQKNINGITLQTVQTQYTPSAPYLPVQIFTHNERTGSAQSYDNVGIYCYDNHGHLIESLDHVGKDCEALTQCTYNSLGNILTKSSSLANSLQNQRLERFTYDPLGRFPIVHTNTLLESEYMQYDPLWGKVISKTDIAGLNSKCWLDAYGRISLQKSVRGIYGSVSYAWDIGSRTNTAIYSTLTHQPGSPDVTEWFDARGRTVSIQKTGFNNSDLSGYTYYDQTGKVSIEMQPVYTGESGRVSIIENDIYGRPTVIIDQFGTTYIDYSYPGDGTIVTTTTDPAGRQRKVTKDPTGKVVKSVDDGGTLTFKYDGLGNQTQVLMDGSVIQTIAYDDCGYKNQVETPNSGTTKYTFDGFGQLISETDALGHNHTMSYDAAGRVQFRYGAEGTTAYTYKTLGQYGVNQVATISVAGSLSKSFQYDAYGANTQLTEVINGHTIVTQHQFEPNTGNLLREIYNSGISIKYTHDANGYLTKITDESTGNILYKVNSMNCFGQATSYDLGNGLTSTLETNFGVPTRYYTPGFQDLKMTYNWATQNMTQRQDAIASLTENFTYDSNDRLLTSQVVGQSAMSFSYQPNGNIATKTDVGSLTYDPGKINAVRHISNPSGLVSLNEQDISYTSFGQPSVITENGNELTYLYGPEYARNYSTLRQAGTAVRSRLYSGNYEINYDLVANTSSEQHYIYGNNGLVAIIVKPSNGPVKEYYTLCDHLQSILTVLDDVHAIAAQQSFDAWGRYRNPSDWSYNSIPPVGTSTIVTSWMYRGYTSHEHLPEFALINMNGRMYDPLLGRMLGPDKIIHDPLNTQCYNSYTYANNNPLKYADPSGWDYDGPYSFEVTNVDGDYTTTSITVGYGDTYTTTSYTYSGDGTLTNFGTSVTINGDQIGSGELSQDGILNGSGILFNINVVLGAGEGVYSILEGFQRLGQPNAIPIAAENLENNFIALVQLELPWKITDDPDVALASERMGRSYVSFINSIPEKSYAEWGNLIGKAVPFAASIFTGTGEVNTVEVGEISTSVEAVSNEAAGAVTKPDALALYWPANGGALGSWEDIMAKPGQVFDRYGSPGGTYMSDVGTPIEMRALSSSTPLDMYMQIEVLKSFPMQQSVISPAFYQIGLGMQYQTPVSLYYLQELGYIRMY